MNYNQRGCPINKQRFGNPYAPQTVDYRLTNGSDTDTKQKTLSMVYSPYQKWQNIYDSKTGLKNGTIFQDLDMPFYGYRQNGSKCGCGGMNK